MNCRRVTRVWRPQLRHALAVMAACYLGFPVARAAAQMPTVAEPPTIEKVIIEKGGASHIEGEGRPGDFVVIVSGGVALGEATVAQSGRWRIELKTGLKAGTYQLRAEARAGADGAPAAGDEIRIAIPAELGGRTEVQYDGTTSETERATRKRAEALAREAGQAFEDVTQNKIRVDPAVGPIGDDAETRESVERSDETTRDGAVAMVIEWLKRSAKTYREEVVDKLRVAKPEVAATDPVPSQSTEPAGDPVAIAPVDAQQTATSIATERAEAEARGVELVQVDANRKAEQAVAEREAMKREQAEELARKKTEADKRIAEELEQLKKARDEVEAEARRIELAQADAARKAEQAAKAAAEGAQREALKRKQAEELARKKAEADKRIAEELERLKKAREEADRAKAPKDAEPRSDTPQHKATITLERFYLPGEKRPREEKTSDGETRAAVMETDEGAGSQAAGRCAHGRVEHRKGRRWYVTGADDTLWDIAERFYGSGLAYPRIYRVNRKRLSSPHVVRPCLALRLPGRS